MDFYDDIAERYDAITDLPQRTAAAAGFVSELVARYSVKSALDAACGTGLYAIELARLGVRAVGADISAAMVEQARKRAAAAGVSVNWIVAPMQELCKGTDADRGATAESSRQCLVNALPRRRGSGTPTHLCSLRFDAILCMGNSIPHVHEQAELEQTLRGFVELLNPGGIVAIQLLNYARVLERQERIVGISRQDQREYVRFYDFLDPFVRFNILEIDWSGPTATNRLHSTLLRPWTHEAICTALGTAGCESIESFGDIKFGPFIAEQSDTVMLIGRTETTTTR